jgi:hypothetical protein
VYSLVCRPRRFNLENVHATDLVLGDFKHVRDNAKHGKVSNQKLHSFSPFAQILSEKSTPPGCGPGLNAQHQSVAPCVDTSMRTLEFTLDSTGVRGHMLLYELRRPVQPCCLCQPLSVDAEH